jgi:excisionase family DNA binding protein
MQMIGDIDEQDLEQRAVPAVGLKLLLTVDEAARALGVRRTFFYTKLLRTGDVFSVKLQGRRLVSVQELHEYVARLVRSQKAGY